MCNISNSHGRARKARLGNLRSEGYEMGLAKGRGFSAKRSAGHFRVGSVLSAGNRPFQKSAISPWKVGSLWQENFTRNLHGMRKIHKKFAFGKFHKKFAFGSTFVGSENVLSRQLHVALKNLLRQYCRNLLTSSNAGKSRIFNCW